MTTLFIKALLLEHGIKKLAETSDTLALAAKHARPDLYAAYPVVGATKGDKEVGQALKGMNMDSTPNTDKDLMSRITKGERKGRGNKDYLSRYKEALHVFEPYKDWYTSEGHEAINKHFKTGVTHYGHFMAGLLAAQSPKTRTGENLKNALEAADSFIMGRPLTNRSTTLSPLENSVRAAHGHTNLSGLKVHSFDNNLKGDLDFTTVDSHFIAALHNQFEDGVTPANYKKAVGTNRWMSQDMGWHPAEAQAAGWAFNKARVGGNDPWFHKPGTAFHHYSELAGGHLPVTDKRMPTTSFGSFLEKNQPTIEWFTDRWDKKIGSNPSELKRVGGKHYTHDAFLRADEMSDSDITHPSQSSRFVHTLLGGGLLPGQNIASPEGDSLRRNPSGKNFPEIQKEMKRIQTEGIKIANSIRMAYLLEAVIANYDSLEVKKLIESAEEINEHMRLLS